MNRKEVSALICNVLLTAMVIIGTILAFRQYGTGLLKYYTVDSNLLCFISGILYVLFMLMKRKQEEIPYWVMVLRLMATVCLAITFIVVVAYLAPIRIWKPDGTYLENLRILLFQGDMFYQHLLCPIISFISFVFLEGDRRLNKKKNVWFGMLPTFVYGIIMLMLNILGKVNGPYPFFRIGEDPTIYGAVMGAILAMNYILARTVLILNQKNAPRRMKKK